MLLLFSPDQHDYHRGEEDLMICGVDLGYIAVVSLGNLFCGGWSTMKILGISGRLISIHRACKNENGNETLERGVDVRIYEEDVFVAVFGENQREEGCGGFCSDISDTSA